MKNCNLCKKEITNSDMYIEYIIFDNEISFIVSDDYYDYDKVEYICYSCSRVIRKTNKEYLKDIIRKMMDEF